MKKLISTILILCFCLGIYSCSKNNEDDLEESTTTDTTAPVIAEVTAVTTPTNDTTPNYTFSSDEAGTITYGGSCSSGTTSATSGNNTITLVSLSEGTYSNCTITVTDSAGNVSSSLTITSFIVDLTAATLEEVTAVTTPTNDTTPDYTFSSSEAGTITYGGSCSSSTSSATTDNNTITLVSLSAGTYSNCTITVTDSSGNSVTLNISSFVIDTTAPTVTSVSTTADNQSLVSLTDNITVTFSKAMDTTNVTTSTSDTNCAGTIRVSSDNFSNCVRMSSEPVSSNSNKTFTLDPNDNLTFGLTYLTRVTTGVKDTAGNALSSQYETTNGFTTAESISISSSASDNASVGIGKTYQYQVNTGGTYPADSVTYSLSNAPDNMTISSSGLVEWTPTTASDIKTYDNITITLTTASGYVLTESYDLTVTGTCVSGNVMSIWSGDQRTSTDSTKFLGNITAYTDNASDICGSGDNEDCTAENNYHYTNSSVDLTWGPTPTATTGNVFFYNQYDNTSHLYLFYMFGVKNNSSADTIKIDIFTDNNSSTDSVLVEDDSSSEIAKQSSGCGSSAGCYKGRHSYNNANSDGGVIGPFSGTDFKIFIDLGGTSTIDGSSTLTLGSLDSFKYYSRDNTSFALGVVDNFTVGYNTTITCE